MVEWFPGLVLLHWPPGKGRGSSTTSSSSSSSSSSSTSRSGGSSGGRGERSTGEKALRLPASPASTEVKFMGLVNFLLTSAFLTTFYDLIAPLMESCRLLVVASFGWLNKFSCRRELSLKLPQRDAPISFNEGKTMYKSLCNTAIQTVILPFLLTSS